jgi:capsular polysaccharide biosynthesis protein
MNEEPLDLRHFGQAVRRHKWLLAAFVAAGLLAGAALSLVTSPRYTAASVVLLPPAALDASGRPLSDVQTQVQIASSTAVLDGARKRLHPQLTVNQLHHRLHVSAPTQQILRFTSTGATSANQAEAIANATAQAYRSYVSDAAAQLAHQTDATVQQRIMKLNAQLAILQLQLDQATSRPADDPAAATLISSLRNQQTVATEQLNAALDQIGQAQLRVNATNAATSIVSPATTASNGAARTAALNLTVGALVGAILGLTLVMRRDARARRSKRPADIAITSGALFVASWKTRVPHRPSEWLDLLEHYSPADDDSWSFRRVLHTLMTADEQRPLRVSILVRPDDEAAVAAAAQLATVAAASGYVTVVAVDGDPLFTALRQVRDITVRSGVLPRRNLSVVEKSLDPADKLERAELVMTMRIAGQPVSDAESDPHALTVLAISAAGGASERIAEATAELEGASDALFGIIVATPEDGTLEPAIDHRIINAQSGHAS